MTQLNTQQYHFTAITLIQAQLSLGGKQIEPLNWDEDTKNVDLVWAHGGRLAREVLTRLDELSPEELDQYCDALGNCARFIAGGQHPSMANPLINATLRLMQKNWQSLSMTPGPWIDQRIERTMIHWLQIVALLAAPGFLERHAAALRQQVNQEELYQALLILADRAIGLNVTPWRRSIERAGTALGTAIEISEASSQARRARTSLNGSEPWKQEAWLKREREIKYQMKLNQERLNSLSNQLAKADLAERPEIATRLLTMAQEAMPGLVLTLAGSAAAWVLGLTSHAPADSDLFSWDNHEVISTSITPEELAIRLPSNHDLYTISSHWKLANLAPRLEHSQIVMREDTDNLLSDLSIGLTKINMDVQIKALAEPRQVARQAALPIMTRLITSYCCSEQPDELTIQRIQKLGPLMSKASEKPLTQHEELSEREIGTTLYTKSLSARQMISGYRGGFEEPDGMSVLSTGQVQVIYAHQALRPLHTINRNQGLGNDLNEHLPEMKHREAAYQLLRTFDIPDHRAAVWLENGELQSLELSDLGWVHPDLAWDGDAERIIKCLNRGYQVPPVLEATARQMMQRAVNRQQQVNENGDLEQGLVYERLVCESGRIFLLQDIYMEKSEREKVEASDPEMETDKGPLAQRRRSLLWHSQRILPAPSSLSR